MIQIKRNNKVFFTLEDFGEGSKLSYQLMDHHYIILKFTTATPVYFEIGDSVEIPDFGYFELTSAYFPKHNDSDGYDYEMQMDAYYMSWKNKLCKYRPQHGANETSFKLTTTVGVHMNVILGNLKALGLTYNGKEFSVDYTTYNNKAFDVQKRFLIEYGSISILDALNAICSEDALNCEWWIDGSIIYLGYCEMEGQTTFEQDVNVLSMSYSESKSTYITRLYAFGSDRNIPKGYFTGADADVTTDGVATDYLMLPNKEVDSDGFYAKDGYLENVNVVKNDKQAIEGVVMFDEEYPKVECRVSSIKTYDSTVDNEDGTKTTQTFWQVTATDSFATSFKESWIKGNLTLGIKFTSGALMGMEFDVRFKVIDKVNYFEIVANDTYGRTLPDGVMCPKVGDKYFLFNWDATKITDTDLIPTAQLSLYERAKQYYQKSMISNANFTCTMDGDKFYNNGTYDYHPLGEQVKLINDMFAQVDADGKHYRNSRIIGMEIPLDIPYDHPQYTVGEKASSSRLGKLEDKVDSITVNGIQINGGNGGGGVYVIGTNDSTPPTDSNVLSARKSINNFLSKLKPDTAQELITFAKGLVSNALAKLNGGAYFGNGGALIDENGNIIADSLKSLGFDKVLNEGFGMEMDGGQSHLYLANLTVWGKMMINILEIMKTKYAGGNIYMSAAGGTIVKVVPVMYINEDVGWEETSESWCDGWKCYILADDGDEATTNPWVEGDQVRCQSMGNLLGTRYANATNKSYWRTIPEHGVSSFNEYIYNDYGTPAYNGKIFYWIVLGKHSKDFDGYTEENAPTGTTDIPEAGDSIVLDGSRKDTSRQGVLQLSSYGSGAPSIVGLRGVSDYSHDNCAIFELSYDYVRIFAERFKLIAKDNKVVEITNFRGEWLHDEKYYKNDQVSHNNAIWTCVKDADFQTEPTDGSTYWRKEVYGQKGEDGSSFKVLGTAVKHFTNADDIGEELLTTKEYLFDDTSGLPDGVASPCIATYMKVGAGHTWIICKSNDGDSYMIGDDLWTNSGTAWLNIGNVKGVSISSTSVTYGVSASGTQEPSSWSSVIPPTTDEYPYLWTRTVVNYTDGKSTTSFSVSHNGKDGEKGETGDKGADAITIQLVGAPLIFDAGSDGIVPKGVTNYARLYVTVGEKDVSEYVGQPFRVSSEGMNVSEGGYMIDRREYNEKMAWYLGIKSDAISKVYLSDNKTEVSATSGYITFAFVYGVNQYVAQLPFQVNVAMYTGELTLTNKQFEVKMRELSTNYDNLPLKTTAALTDYTTSIKQTAREISLSVSEKTIGRRNLLVGSAFQRDDNNRVISNDAKIEMNSGYQGTNCIHVNDTTEAGSPHYVGAYWDGSQNGRSIKIKKGKKYTMSCFYKTNDINAKFSFEAIYTNKQENATRLGHATNSSSRTFTVKKVNEWELFTVVVDTADAKSDYIAFNFWEACDVSAGQIEAWICRPMVEEGDTYNGWTLSTEDYGYVGGNMLDNTRTLDKSGTLYDVNGTLTPAGFGESTSIYKSFNYKLKGTVSSFSQLPSSGNVYGDTYFVRNTQICYRYNGSEFESVGNDYYYDVLEWRKLESGGFVPFGLEANKDYVFSFMAKGTGKLTAYFYYPETNVFIESSLGETDTSIDGAANFQLTSDWKKYWVHWRPSDSSHKYVLLRLNRTIQSSAGDAPITDCYIAQPKIEEGAVVTEYTERKSDLVDKASLKKAGIEVKSDEVLLYGDKIRVDNNGQTAAMFIGGKLNAAFIDADKIEVKHLWAKSNDGANKVGYFGNTEEEACKIDDTYAPLFVGADTAKNSPFYVTNKGHMVSKSATLGSFSLNESSLRYLTGYDDEEPGFALYNEYMVFRGYSRTFSPQTKKWTSERNRLIWVGRNDWVYSVPSLMSNILVQDSFPMTTDDTAKIGLRISVTGCDDKYQYENVMYNGAMGSNVYGNFAIYAENGMYAGFRPMTRRVNYSMKLTELDCVIYVPVTGITLTLPDNPQRGQCYKFIQGSGDFYIKSSSKNIYSNGGQTDKFRSGAYNQTTEIIWLDDHWRINWFRESVGK